MIFDLHCDTILRIYHKGGTLKKNEFHIDVEKMLKGPSRAQFFAMFIHLESVDDPYKACHTLMDRFDEEVALNPEIAHVKTLADYDQAIKDNKIAGIITIEEGGVIQGDLKKLNEFFDRGCRSMTLTWNYVNEISSPNAKDINGGLTPFGIEVVKEMNHLGMLIDVSHLSDAGFWDCIKYSKQPIIASHSNSRVVCDHLRNLTDDMIKALHLNGGVMGMNFCSYFLDGTDLSKVSSIVKHINYIRDLVGIDVIALGTDFDGIGGTLEIADMGKMHLLKEALEAADYSKEDIEKIFYKNAERVFRSVIK